MVPSGLPVLGTVTRHTTAMDPDLTVSTGMTATTVPATWITTVTRHTTTTATPWLALYRLISTVPLAHLPFRSKVCTLPLPVGGPSGRHHHR